MNSIGTNTPYFNAPLAPPALPDQSLAAPDQLVDAMNKTSEFGNSFFDKVTDGISIVAALMPAAMALVSLGTLIKSIISVQKASLLGTGKYITQSIKDLLENILNILRRLVNLFPLIAKGAPIISSCALAILSIVGGVLASIVYSIDAIKEAVYLYRTHAIASKIDKILASKLSPNEKMGQILTELNKEFTSRKQPVTEKINSMPMDLREKAEIFLSKQVTEELESLLGKRAYSLIKEAVSHLSDKNFSVDSCPEAIVAIMEARELLGAKMKHHIISIVIDVVSVAATILAIIFPAFGIGLVIAYVLWTVFILLFSSDLIVSFKDKLTHQLETNFKKSRNVVHEKILHAIEKHFKPASADRIDILFSKERYSTYVSNLKVKLTNQVAFKLKKFLAISTDMKPEEIEAKLSKASISTMKKLLMKVSKDQIEISRRSWRFMEQLRIIERAPNTFYSEALKA